MTDEDLKFMNLALELAKKAELKDEVPVGAVIVQDGKVIGSGMNTSISDHDPTSHAEINAIREAAKLIQNYRLKDCSIYVTLEPCPMCAGALYWAQLGELYLGAKDSKRGFRQCNTHMLHPKTKVAEGLMEKESEQLLLDFFQGLRKKSL